MFFVVKLMIDFFDDFGEKGRKKVEGEN